MDPSEDDLLMIPGPTNLPDAVRQALAQPSIYHRGERAAEVLANCTEGLKPLFGTEGDVLILTSSGTGGLEAAVTNFLSPGDRVLCVEAGKFGERMGDIAESFGARVSHCRFAYGQAADPQVVRDDLERGDFRALLCTYNETSTGVMQDVAALAEVAREAGCLVMVDCISCLGGVPVLMDEWGLDVVVAGSQKCLMLPPGLAFVAVRPGSWAAAEAARMPRYYFDLPKAVESLRKGQTPYTPNTSLLVALEASLRLIEGEGLGNVFARHRAMANAVRAAMGAARLELFADPKHASDTVTAGRSPCDCSGSRQGVDSVELVQTVWERHRVLISGGQGDLKGRIFRIGHMGMVQLPDVLRTLDAVADGLEQLGCACDAARMKQAAEEAARGG